MLYDLSATLDLLNARQDKIESKIRRAEIARAGALARSKRIQAKAHATLSRSDLAANVQAWNAYRRAAKRLSDLHALNVFMSEARTRVWDAALYG